MPIERTLTRPDLHRTPLELIAECKLRRRPLTDDGDVEITSLGSCSPARIRGNCKRVGADWGVCAVCRPRCGHITPGSAMDVARHEQIGQPGPAPSRRCA